MSKASRAAVSRIALVGLCLLTALFFGCNATNSDGLVDVNLLETNLLGSNERKFEKYIESGFTEDFVHKFAPITDERTYKDSLGAYLYNTDLVEWLTRLMEKWDNTKGESTDYWTTHVTLRRCYLKHVSTSMRAVIVADIKTLSPTGKEVLSGTYRGSEHNVNYMGGDNEYAACLRTATKELWASYLAELSEAVKTSYVQKKPI